MKEKKEKKTKSHAAGVRVRAVCVGYYIVWTCILLATGQSSLTLGF